MPQHRCVGPSIVGFLSVLKFCAATYAYRPSDDDVLKALDRLLARDDFPWRSPELTEVRPVIEQAVNERNTKLPDLTTAVHKLLGFGGAIALGVAGNSVYDVLKAFVSLS
jgi:hypothetical protein